MFNDQFLSLSRISELQSDDGDKSCRVCYYYMLNDHLRVDISITQGRTPFKFKSITRVPLEMEQPSSCFPFETVSVISYVHLRPFRGYSLHNFIIPSRGGPSGHASPIPSQREESSDSSLTPPSPPVAGPTW
jgi:hypothetical protein